MHPAEYTTYSVLTNFLNLCGSTYALEFLLQNSAFNGLLQWLIFEGTGINFFEMNCRFKYCLASRRCPFGWTGIVGSSLFKFKQNASSSTHLGNTTTIIVFTSRDESSTPDRKSIHN